jgi:hypothetical protein
VSKILLIESVVLERHKMLRMKVKVKVKIKVKVKAKVKV